MSPDRLFLFQSKGVDIVASDIAKQHRCVGWIEAHVEPIDPGELKSLQVDNPLSFAARGPDSKHTRIILKWHQEVNEVAVLRPRMGNCMALVQQRPPPVWDIEDLDAELVERLCGNG